MVRGIIKILSGLLLLFAYYLLVAQVCFWMQKYIPLLIFGTWRSYVIWGLMATAIDTIFMLILWGLGWLAAFFYRPMLIRIIGCAMSAIACILSEVHLWQFIDALYYASFWEYLWGCILTLLILIPYIGLPLYIFYYSHKKEEIQ